jgi:hypothetical protein
VKLDKSLPAGPWLARLDLESGLLKRSATATITFPTEGEAAPVSATPVVEEKKASPPYALLGGGAIGLLALAGLIFFLLKRRSRPQDERGDRAGEAAH